ncbi:MAG: phosphoglucosamine mutase [Halanaerobiales bacterium]
MTELFGTDGIRGVANRELTGELAYRLGRAGGYYLARNYEKGGKPVFLIGKDTRVSGDMLEAALISGLTSAGIDVVKLDIIPTPGVAYLTKISRAAGGIMISASHNPVQDNGIKFFNSEGLKLTDSQEEKIEELILEKEDQIFSPIRGEIGLVEEGQSSGDKYVEHLLSSVNVDFSGLKIVLDCACGAAFHISPRVFKELGAELEIINDRPDGLKINVDSGTTSPEILREKVLETGADLGVAHDGDADRVILVDEKGGVIDGDGIMAVLGISMLEEGQLNKKTVVTTPYSNFGLRELLEEHSARMETAKNGDRYVLQKMLKNGYNLGGEQSGHIILLDYNCTGDGILTALQVVQEMVRKEKKLSELAGVLNRWPQRLRNVKVDNKQKLETSTVIKRIIQNAGEDLGDEGRVFIRASGTEPVIRIMLEGKEPEQLEYWERKIADVVASELN